jgi:hypothetical protein
MFRALLFIMFVSCVNYHICPMIKTLNILTLERLELGRTYFDLIELYKTVNKYTVSNQHNALQFCNLATHNTRGHRFKLVVNRTRTNLFINYFVNRVVNIWNCLPADCFNSNLTICFKREICKLDLSNFMHGRLQKKRALFIVKEHTYWTRKLDMCSGNSKQLWRCLNTILLRDNVPVNTTLITAQSLSSFFIEKVTRVCQATRTCPPAVFTGPCLNQLNGFTLCSVDDIRRVIIQSPGKSYDLDP